MERTVCELFAGVGGFRCGLNSIKTNNFDLSSESWKTVWFNQWEPGKKNQWAHDCYVKHFGTTLDLSGNDTTNIDISIVDKNLIPDHSLLVGGFPCQDYSVARSLNGEKGIQGKKGVLWWSIWDILKIKKSPFVLLENVDRLLLSPSKQRGRDFGIILSCLNNEGYIVEWRIVNAAEYGEVQRRKRTFIFAYKNNTNFAKSLNLKNDIIHISEILEKTGFFAKTFPVKKINPVSIATIKISSDIADVSDNFHFPFSNSGIMFNGSIYSVKTEAIILKSKNLEEILEKETVDEKYFIPDERLYFTNPESTHSDETKKELPLECRHTWQYIKGAKRKYRTAGNGHKYIYSEGAIPMIDEWNKPARTMLTSEGSFNRSTHIVRDFLNQKIRILTPKETERIQGFPDDWTSTGMPEKFRYFCMGNALVVPVITKMENTIKEIFISEK
ncbi:DNA (cytosine-5-)-methyltransferase [Treponema pectinovorum]|uniref:DNA (cytosine-5-)-methyltransferase n=1 Tax=Treponema pectinovorum TaxID=164 RepID=UPI0011F1EE67|nr:DNA (cytosine-5-)-methyltransferase [Treponema pectinovorum]